MRWRRKVVESRQEVSAVFARHARRTRRGVAVRCNRGRGALGPIIFPSPAAARAAVQALADLGHRYAPAVCVRGRHWHLHPIVDGQENPGDDLETAS